jgi:hypothetical protein
MRREGRRPASDHEKAEEVVEDIATGDVRVAPGDAGDPVTGPPALAAGSAEAQIGAASAPPKKVDPADRVKMISIAARKGEAPLSLRCWFAS